MSTQGPSGGQGGRGPGAVRPYVITGGRSGTPDAEPLPLETLVIASGLQLPAELQPEYRRIVEMCQGLLSVAEVCAHLGQPPTVVRVLLTDLIESGHVRYRPPVGLGYIPARPHHTPTQGPGSPHQTQRQFGEQDLLRKVLHGLEDRI